MNAGRIKRIAVVIIGLAGLRAAPGAPGAYIVVDTSQATCFDDFAAISCPDPGESYYGQDAQYHGTQPSYTLSGDGLTVHDNNTGLTWVRDPDLNGDGKIDVDDKLTYSEAQDYPATLNSQNYGGYSDWRAPTIKELYSLMDFRGTDPNVSGNDPSLLTPYIDTDYFKFTYGDTAAGERIIDSQWVTNTLYVGTVFGNRTAMFGVNFADGRIKGYPADRNPDGSCKTFYARFCRGNSDYGVNDFIDNGDGTITDKATGLIWMQTDSGAFGAGPFGDGRMNWEDALAWAEDLEYAGYDDWRLPNAKELQSIVDYSRSPDTTGSAAIDPLFSSTAIINVAGDIDYPFYWTGTTHIRQGGTGGAGVYIAFGRGLGSMDGVNVIDVHGAGCQRGDPKDGDPADYPSWGHGPQGDLQRVFNYVRCVRSGGESAEPTPTPAPPVLAAADYNGDGTDDIAIFRAVSGFWAVRGVTRTYMGGDSGDVPVSGDYDGDGTTDISLYRGSLGLWAVKDVTRAYFGSSLDTPVPGDYDGDGSCDMGVFRESNGHWAIRGVTRVYFGSPGDRPVPGDYNGDGTAVPGIFRESSGVWALRGISRFYFGSSQDDPVPGDYDGNGFREVGIFRSASGLWALRGVSRFYFGGSADLPAPADYDGDGTDDVGIFRGPTGLWAVKGVSRVYYGSSGDIPVTR